MIEPVRITFEVFTSDGENPPTKGSASGFPIRRAGGRIGVVITNDNPKNKKWAINVAAHARQAALEGRHAIFEGPLHLGLVFTMKRPKAMPKGRIMPVTKPDLDKMIRSVKDALTGILYIDDAQICTLTGHKIYGGKPGVYVELTKGGSAT